MNISTNASESAAAEPGSILDTGGPLLVAGIGGALPESLLDGEDSSGGSKKCLSITP